jgi:A/G-specific adenine glycosylase
MIEKNKDILSFQKKILSFGEENFRHMPWRETADPYFIFISEIMLQQTQVDRVMVKYQEFVRAFPKVQKLARASFQEVLQRWSGLGYNRRALFLHRAAHIIHEKYNDLIPQTMEELVELPGIGSNTAAAIMVYAFNKPVIFIETNIRSVFIHEFFTDKEGVDDREIIPLVEESLYKKNPRKWYWALMDYGSVLKKQQLNPSRKSKHYAKQSTFKGSDRQVRGAILRTLLQDTMTFETLFKHLSYSSDQTQKNLEQLIKEGLITKDEKDLYS